MIYVVLGVLGLLVIHLADVATLNRLPLFKPLVIATGTILVVWAMVGASLWPDRIRLPAWTLWLGWVLLAVSLLFTLYAVFISLPFRRTYLAAGAGGALTTTGLYALVRHPWLPWAILLILALILVSRSRLILMAAPLFVFLQVLIVVIQDRVVFRRAFAGYDRYRAETPMLIPNRKSMEAFARSCRPARRSSQEQGGNNDVRPS